jgi:hypothetical protein
MWGKRDEKRQSLFGWEGGKQNTSLKGGEEARQPKMGELEGGEAPLLKLLPPSPQGKGVRGIGLQFEVGSRKNKDFSGCIRGDGVNTERVVNLPKLC